MRNSKKNYTYPRAVLRQVENPAQYLGNEWNSIDKSEQMDHWSKKQPMIRFGFCFPDVYEIGMSNMALRILYDVINQREDTWCERFFSPQGDLRAWMQKESFPLISIESKTPLSEYDFVGFTLQYELSFPTILDMLHLGNVKLHSLARDETDPIVIGGGPIVYNPEPLADFFDLFIIGDGEEIIHEVIDLYQTWNREQESRESFLLRCAKIDGIYVPRFYEAEYYSDGKFKNIKKLEPEVPAKINKRIVRDLNKANIPLNPIVPNTSIVHDRAYIELFRGCPRGCRFCQAGMVYRPTREREVDLLVEQAQQIIAATGYDQLGLLSLSTGDYSELEKLSEKLLEFCNEKRVNLSLPSLRLDSFSFELMEKVSKTRKTGLTFAPEAGSQRLRDIINKDISEEDLLDAARIAFSGGWHTIKLYFMLGLPFETDEDVLAIADLVKKVLDIHREENLNKKLRKPQIHVSTSFFIPKAWTPFQWQSQISITKMQEKQSLLANNLRYRGVKYFWHEFENSTIQGVISRGDRKIGKVIEDVWRSGGWLESWDENFSYERWKNAMDENNLSIDFYTSRKRELDEDFPWDHIQAGVTKEFLIHEYEKAEKGLITTECREDCHYCGSMIYQTGVCLSHVASQAK
ncbi:MAG: TIGR03960 family B12-binding radical SAM protein [Clostridiaceae bacterium]|nr:TIGR03960 family B12-binding radical SAM protein [Clostridiaceae bacterium]